MAFSGQAVGAAGERQAAITCSVIYGHYEKLVDRESAYELLRAEKALEDLTAKHIGLVDDLLKHKEAELLEI